MHGFQPTVKHRDLKTSNLLVNNHWVVKCCDFGLSRELQTVATTRVGSVQWSAPEVLRGEKYVFRFLLYSVTVSHLLVVCTFYACSVGLVLVFVRLFLSTFFVFALLLRQGLMEMVGCT